MNELKIINKRKVYVQTSNTRNLHANKVQYQKQKDKHNTVDKINTRIVGNQRNLEIDIRCGL